MGYASDTLDEKRHKEAELNHLREFYMYWMQMHAKAAERPFDADSSQVAAQSLVDKAKQLREFYA